MPPRLNSLRHTLPYLRRLPHPRAHSTVRIPPEAWDSHMHVTDPRFPLASSAVYAPHAATLADARANASRLGLPNLVFVQVSVYGTDNACQLDGVAGMGVSRARAVVACEPGGVGEGQLWEWHGQGVRGVRINLKSVGRVVERGELEGEVRRVAEMVRPMGWGVQLYVEMGDVPWLVPLADEIGVKMIVDHMGGPPVVKEDMSGVKGWKELLELLQREHVYVKVSAPYRFSKNPEFRDLENIVKELMKQRGGRGVVFASDWPHTRFEGTEIMPWITRCLEWCEGDQELANRLFRDNAERLWDVKPKQ